MFIGVVAFGLFHGLLLLPVLLGLIGPPSHRTHFKRSGISQRLEIDDDGGLCDYTMNNTLDNVNNFNVDLYEHHAKMDTIAKQVMPIGMATTPANMQLFLHYQNSINSNQTVDITPSYFNSIDKSTQDVSNIVQESAI